MFAWSCQCVGPLVIICSRCNSQRDRRRRLQRSSGKCSVISILGVLWAPLVCTCRLRVATNPAVKVISIFVKAGQEIKKRTELMNASQNLRKLTGFVRP